MNVLASMFGAVYFMMSANNISILPVFSLIFFYSVHLFILNSIVAKLLMPDQVQFFSTDKEYGIFGFANEEIAFDAFVYIGFFSTTLGASGYVLSLHFYSPLLVSNCYLLEPFIA